MSSNEDYLDSLLQTLLEEEPAQKSMPEEFDGLKDIGTEGLQDALEQEPSAMPDQQEEAFAGEEIEETKEESVDLEENMPIEEAVDIPAMPVGDDANHKMSAEEIEAMFAALEAEDNNTAGAENDSDNIMAQMQDEPVDFFAQDEEEQENKEEDDGAVPDYGMDEDMMSLLNNVSEEESAKEESGNEFDFFSMDDAAMPQEQEAEVGITALPEDTDGGMPDMDLTKLLEQAEAEQQQQSDIQEQPDREVQQPSGKKNREKKKEKKVKPPKADKKPGFLSRLFTILVGEEDEEETPGNDSIDGYNIDAENKSIIEALDETPRGKTKAKKEKKKKEKKPAKEKTPKEKKEKKPKKERKSEKEKEPKAPAPKGRPLPKKRIAAIVAMGATVLAALLLLTIKIPEMMEKHQAVAAYNDKNYEEAFYLFQGKELKGTEKDTYYRTVLILQLERQLEAYENYLKMDMQLEALNALVKGVDKYEKGLDDAIQYGVEGQTAELYQKMKNILEKDYRLTEADVEDILSQKDDVYYTVSLKQALGQSIPESGAAEETQPEEEQTVAGHTEPEMLPEEALLEQ